MDKSSGEQQQADTTQKAEPSFGRSSAIAEREQSVLDDATLKATTLQSQSTDISLTKKCADEIPNAQDIKKSIEDKENKNDQPLSTYPCLKKFPMGKYRQIANLSVGVSTNIHDFAKDLAEKLLESREDLLLKVLKNVDKPKIIELFKKTQKTEREGGISTDDRSRRRTPGGVFFYHLRGDRGISRQLKLNIFDEDTQKYKKSLREDQIMRM